MSVSPTPTFENDIKPLLRESDREAMLGFFDLWSFTDVTSNAGRIFEAISEGSMPCDKQWPTEKVDPLKRWIDSGVGRAG
jgi:hypothetical protein